MGTNDQESATAEEARRATGAATGRGRGGRFSVGRKREVGIVKLTKFRPIDPLDVAMGDPPSRGILRMRLGCLPVT